MEEEHKEHTDNQQEEWETEERISEEAVKTEILDYLRENKKLDNLDYHYWVGIHAVLTLGTQGVWLMLLLAYWTYKLYNRVQRSDREIYKTYKVKEE